MPPQGMMGPQGSAPYPGQQYAQPHPYPQQNQPFAQQGHPGPQPIYQSPHQKQFIDPYADVVRSPGYSSPPPPPRQQSNYQPGYSGPNSPQ